jgi:formate dehydrogenase subunit beta
MDTYTSLPTHGSPCAALQELLSKFLDKGLVAGVLAQCASLHGGPPMPSLVTTPEQTARAVPLAPAAPLNAARMAAGLTREGGRLLLVLRPCELRALVELRKLHQCDADQVAVLGLECPGRLDKQDYAALEDPVRDTDAFLQDPDREQRLAPVCATCSECTPVGADLTLCLHGPDPATALGLRAESAAGAAMLEALGLAVGPAPDHAETVDALKRQRAAAWEARAAAVRERTATLDALQRTLAACVRCGNCRTACPVCYCRDCVFNTPLYDPRQDTLLRRARATGLVRLPADTLMFHLTRMTHMAHACVGCGQCADACPNGIPVADLFRTTAQAVQELYGYRPGQDPDQPVPSLAYKDAPPEGSDG